MPALPRDTSSLHPPRVAPDHNPGPGSPGGVSMPDQRRIDSLKSEQERLARLRAVVGYPMREHIEAALKTVNQRLSQLQQRAS